jgi:Spy/CpxP family protein refolding chaperone
MKKWMLVGSLMTAVLTTAAWSEPRGMGSKSHGAGPMVTGWVVNNPEKAKELGVTDDQAAALKELSYKTRQQMIKLNAEAETARLEIDRLMDADKPDEGAILKAIENAGRVETEIQKARVQEGLRVREALGDEQLAKIRDTLREERKDVRHDQNARRDDCRKRCEKRCPFMGGPNGGPPEGDDGPPPGDEPPGAGN